MTIYQAITEADHLCHNDIEPELKLQWLSRLDGQLADRVLNKHCGTKVEFDGYDEETDTASTELLAKPPYDELYVRFLIMKIYLAQEDIERYNNAALVYAEALRRWEYHINTTYRPHGVPALRF